MTSKIKEFLKPSLIKILLVVLFGVMAYYFGIDLCGIKSVDPDTLLASVPCYTKFNALFWSPLALFINFSYHLSVLASLILLLGGIIYWYLIASVIMYIHSIFKNEFIKKNFR